MGIALHLVSLVVMQHPTSHLLAQPQSPSAPRSLQTPIALPSRNVNAENIEDIYVQFILACNPAVPADVDTEALREAFQTPPKSRGKSFSTWTLFELITQFQKKQIKTWGELALTLGVEPPDQDKGESSQKIQQYAVRLKVHNITPDRQPFRLEQETNRQKYSSAHPHRAFLQRRHDCRANVFPTQRWMHSMHVDAFYEYLLNNPHPYWTEIPTTSDPVTEGGRDGVAAEDDMALRSLLPHIRPRRGRKRPEERSSSRSPVKRPKTDGGASSSGDAAGTGMEQLDFWPPQPDMRGHAFFPTSQDGTSRAAMDMTHLDTSASPWIADAFARTPGSSHSYHAVTPGVMAANPRWCEQHQTMPKESQPASPSQATTALKQSRRHGAKVVSSAWRTGGSGKTRGRPPTKRQSASPGSQRSESHSQHEMSPFVLEPHGRAGHCSPSTLGQSTPHMSTSSMSTNLLTSRPSLPATTTAPVDFPIFGFQPQDPHVQDQRQLHGRLAIHASVEGIGDDMRMGTPYSHYERDPGPLIMVDAPLTPEQGSMFTPQAFGGSAAQMLGSFTSAGQNVYMPQHHQHQHQHHLHHHHHQQQHHQQHLELTTGDTRIQPLQPEAPSLHSEISGVSRDDMAGTPMPLPLDPHLHLHPRQEPSHLSGSAGGVTYRDVTDRTNLDNVESLLAYGLLNASWHDATGKPISACKVEEAVAIVSELIETVRKGATSQETFVANISTLVGTAFLKNTEGHTVRVYRVEESTGEHLDQQGEIAGVQVYDIYWDLRLGDVRGGFHLRERVNHQKWRDKAIRTAGLLSQQAINVERKKVREDVDRDAEGEVDQELGQLSRGKASSDIAASEHAEGNEAAQWRKKYQDLLGVVQEQNAELSQVRIGMLNLARPREGEQHSRKQ